MRDPYWVAVDYGEYQKGLATALDWPSVVFQFPDRLYCTFFEGRSAGPDQAGPHRKFLVVLLADPEKEESLELQIDGR